MDDETIRIFPLGDSALTVEFGNTISESINKKAIALANRIDEQGFPGFVESVPAYASTTIFYDLVCVRKHFPGFPTAFDAVRDIAGDALKTLTGIDNSPSRAVEIPVHFDAESALDLAYVA